MRALINKVNRSWCGKQPVNVHQEIKESSLILFQIILLVLFHEKFLHFIFCKEGYFKVWDIKQLVYLFVHKTNMHGRIIFHQNIYLYWLSAIWFQINASYVCKLLIKQNIVKNDIFTRTMLSNCIICNATCAASEF